MKKKANYSKVDYLDYLVPSGAGEKSLQPDDYSKMLSACKKQEAISSEQAERFKVIAHEMKTKHDGLTYSLVLQWDSPELYKQLSAELEGLRTVIEVAPVAYEYHRKRAHKLGLKAIEIQTQLNRANVRVRRAAIEAEQIEERALQEADAKAEKERRNADKLAVKQAQEAEQQAKRQAKQERDTNYAESLAKWLKMLQE